MLDEQIVQRVVEQRIGYLFSDGTTDLVPALAVEGDLEIALIRRVMHERGKDRDVLGGKHPAPKAENEFDEAQRVTRTVSDGAFVDTHVDGSANDDGLEDRRIGETFGSLFVANGDERGFVSNYLHCGPPSLLL